ncbi:hypothetical protein ACQUWM_03990 [Marinobacter sp. DUT-3]|uniref:hypothetical protein n=1 Tax=unclassified Marinobacter TaxID=83889 RepID=UPI00387AC02D
MMLVQQRPSFLVKENQQYAGTGGLSENNAHARFVPAFKDSYTGQVEISRYRDGRPAPFHLVDGLPEEWITNRDLASNVVELKATVISGFVRLGRFFTRQEASDFVDQLTS